MSKRFAMNARRLAVLSLAVASIAPGLAARIAVAQSPRPMTLVDLINVPRISDPQLSPDGREIAYVWSAADWKANKRVTHIWRVEAAGGAPAQLTNGPGAGESSPRWSPDGRTLAFLARRPPSDRTEREEDDPDGPAQIFLISTGGGEARPLTRHPTSVSNISWSPEGAGIYFVAEDDKNEDQKKRDKAKDDVYAFDESYQQRHLWRVAVADGAERRITSGDFSIGDFELSRDGRRIVIDRAPNPLIADQEKGELWITDADGGGAVQITRNGVAESSPALSPDGSRVLFVADASPTFETYYNGKLFVAPASGGAAQALTGALPYDIQSATWSKDGRWIFFVAGTGVETQLFRLDAAGGKPAPLTRGQHAVRGWSYVPSADRHVMTLDQPANPGEAWTLAADGGAPAQVTHVLEHVARDYWLPKQEAITWKGADGVTVEGLLFYPIDYQAGRRYPLVVQTHGGPASADQYGFGSSGSYVPVLAAKGYAVLKPNYRGSTGYGDAFLRDMVGSYFKNSHLDVMAGVDQVIAMGVADPDRLAKMGWSGGGHMTNKIVTFTNRFKAASSGAGAANWVSMYAQSDVRTYRTPWFGGTPWQKSAPIDVYWEHSPLKYVAHVTTPTIFLVGERDVRVPMPQSVEMYRALKSNGVPTKLYVAPREPHGWQELRHQLFKMNVELDWFERWVTKRPYEWERAPGDEERKKTN
jgi:dipeptidyl aminopeptidase/acylaminoacyl peptidase